MIKQKSGAKDGHGRKPEAGWKPFARRLALSLGVALALLAALLAGAAAVCLSLDIAPERLPAVAIPLTGAAAFAAGFLQVRPQRRQGLFQGLLTAAALYVVVLAAAAAFSRAALGVGAVVLLLVVLPCGAAGGIFAVNHAGERRTGSRKKHGAKARIR